jgi:stress-induced morphogen
MAMAATEIETMIKAALPDAVIEITDLAGDNNHFAAKVISASFEGMSRLARTRVVYAALGGRMGEELHALQLTTATPS